MVRSCRKSSPGARTLGVLVAGVVGLAGMAQAGTAQAAGQRTRKPVGAIRPGTYVVVPGDTVSRIARRAGLSVAAVAAANGLAAPAYRIRAGQRVVIPGKAAAAPGKGAAPVASPARGTLLVSAGDTLERIARRHGTSVAALAAANGLGPPYTIRVGQTLRLAGGRASASRPAPAPVPPAPPRPAPAPARGAAGRGGLLDRWAGAYGIPATLAKAVAWVESGWKPGARSPKGAMGVMQLMPGTALWIQDRLVHQAIDPWNPEHNVHAGLAYLRWLLGQWRGDERLALASYYQGIGSVRRSGVYVVSEAYVRKVQSARARF